MRDQNKINYGKKYYREHADIVKARSHRRYVLNRDEILAKHKINNKNRDIRELLLQRAKSRAKRGNLPFNIELDDIIIPDFCPILLIPLKRNLGMAYGGYDSYSLDKIDPTLGYVKGNIQVISHRANYLKSNASYEELIRMAEYVKGKLDKTK